VGTKVILELGGNIARMDKAIELSLASPGSWLVVSSEGDPAACLQKLQSAGVDPSRTILDYKAWDTVTNFTNTKPLIESLAPSELMVVTDGFHMLRAMSIARLVYFGASFSVTAHPSSPVDHHESKRLVISDTLRAILSRFTGNTLYYQTVYDDRIQYIYDCYYSYRKLQGG